MKSRIWFKVRGRHTKIKSAKFPEGYILEVHFGAESKKHALKMCEEKGITEVEYCEADPNWEPGLEK